ncbi:hypothetical protein AcW1_008125 [Taiwanofungus camphoratus]|nr:hypothetical protein AcV5_008426 [Antrodia cinnamomea]KAI0950962.1 hypothetical protein AcW1_008125 [Antrodia cinnamomea]KAI0955874.1 hypothetical protein AcV7_006417 [Antrodia cinnamomea]
MAKSSIFLRLNNSRHFKRLSLPWLVCLTLTIHLDDIILHVVVFRSIKLVCRVW